jgi:HD-GYP domain-containing protein (c-di-GMP phosphodiesterase class II)
MNLPNEEYYTRSVTELADIVPVTTSQEVFSTTGIKLVNRNVRLDSSFFERLGRHNILPPLEQCLVVENGVNNFEIVTLAQKLLISDAPLAHMVSMLTGTEVLFEVLQEVALSDPMVFLLTLARERRPELFTHSVTVALICMYLGLRLSLPKKKIIELATAGLLHDVGELRIDASLLQEGAHPTPEQREKIYTHPSTSQRMLLNSSYSLEIVNAVMRHHEYIDGSGFPFSLVGIEMGETAKILSIAEVAATKLEQEALDGILRLEVALKFNIQKFDPELLSFLSVLYHKSDENSDDIQTITLVSLANLHSQLNNIGLAILFWNRLMGDLQMRPRTPSAYIHQRLNNLSQATREVGINTSDQTSVTNSIDGDEICLAELYQINRETLRQIKEIVFEVQRRWPSYQKDETDVGRVVSSWIGHMQGLLLQECERKR